jgi:hypothetical protein
MANVRLRYVKSTDRHGRIRHYLGRAGHKLVPLPGLPGSTEFMETYAAALELAPDGPTVGLSRTRAGSVSAMIVGYLASAQFHRLAPATQQQYRRIFERLRREHGDRSKYA